MTYVKAILPYLGILVLAAAFTVGARSQHFVENRALRAREARLEADVDALALEVRRLEMRLAALRERDPQVIERQIRERFGYTRPGEIAVPLATRP